MGVVCPACNKPEEDHLVISIAQLGTEADCSWILRLMEIENWLRDSGGVLSLLGISNAVSGDVTRKLAELIAVREDEIRNEAFSRGHQDGWQQCHVSYQLPD